MQIVTIESSTERSILAAMAVNDAFCGWMSQRWRPSGLLASRASNTICHWFVTYYTRYGRAPGEDVSRIWRVWSGAQQDSGYVESVRYILQGLSAEATQDINLAYIQDLAGDYLVMLQLGHVADAVRSCVDKNDLKGAQSAINYTPLDLSANLGLDVLQNEAAMIAAFNRQNDCVLRYPGPLGVFLSDTFERDGFISLMGPEKRGKTWWLLDFAWEAMCQRKRVAFFEVGDLSEPQILRRFGVRAVGRPIRESDLWVPTGLQCNEVDGDMVAVVQREQRRLPAITGEAAVRGCISVMRNSVKSHDSYLKCVTVPAGSLSVQDISNYYLTTWQRQQQWVPDVIVVDYADILAPPPGVHNERDQISKNWEQLRGLSQKWHALVLTATQANAASYGAHTITRQHFSNDKRKLAHVTGMIGLNQTPEEKIEGLMRLNWVLSRDLEISEYKCAWVAGCLGLARPAMFSVF